MHPTARQRMLRGLLPVLAAAIGTFFFHRYSLLTGLTDVQADTGDSRFVAAILEHWNNVFHGTAAWPTVPIFWPVRDTLAYSDALLGMGIVHAALRTTFGVFPAVNAQEILLTLLTFLTTYVFLARGAGLATAGATLGASFAAFCWPRFAYLPHVQLQFTAPLPLLFLLVIEAMRDGLHLSRARVALRLVAAAALLALLLATVVYFAIYALLTILVALGLVLLYPPGRRHILAVIARQWPALLAGGGAAVALNLPIVLFYLPLVRANGGRTWAEVVPGLPHLHHFFWMGRENWLWGDLFARFPESELVANWPEFRIGVGIVASMLWGLAILWALATLVRRRPLPARTAMLLLFVLTGLTLQLSMLALPGDRSAWWFIWRFLPGANGLRSIARLELVVVLAMAAWFGTLLDRAIARPAITPKVLAALLVSLCAIEQFGASHIYDGVRMEAFERKIAAQLAAPCPAVFVTGTPNLVASPILDESHFDPARYLAANPDVARNWKGTAWSHYDLLGRAEGRLLDAGAAYERGLLETLGYAYTLPLAAVLAHKPVVNGLSGTEPVGWNVTAALSAKAPQQLAAWLARRNVDPAAVCTLPLEISLREIPFLPEGMWP